MSDSQSLQQILLLAKQQEKSYDWLEAVKIYERVLQSESITAALTAETWESIGVCYRRASRQACSPADFRKLRQLAVQAYEKAADLFERLKKQGRSAQCNALVRYVRSWLASTAREKGKLLDEARHLGNESLQGYEDVGDQLSYGKMCNDLSSCLLERLYVTSDWGAMRNAALEGIGYTDKAIAILSKLENENELLRAYAIASLQRWYALMCMEGRRELQQGIVSYAKRALLLSRRVADPVSIALSNWAAAFSTLLLNEPLEPSLEHAEEILKQGSIAKDSYLKGIASYVIAFVTSQMLLKEEDPDKRKEGHRRVIKHAEDAIQNLKTFAQDFFIAGAYQFCVETYAALAREAVTTPEKRRDMSGKAVEVGRAGLEHATRSGSPTVTSAVLHALSNALHFHSRLTTERDEKKRLLAEALSHRKEYANIMEGAYRPNEWVCAADRSVEGLMRAELARAESDEPTKKMLLETAVSEMEDSVFRCNQWISSHPRTPFIAVTGKYENSLGEMLTELFLLTEDKAILNRALGSFNDAATNFRKIGMASRAAESYWAKARAQDRLDAFLQAAEDFGNASAMYRVAAQKLPHFAEFFRDYATYMNAWSEIERAKSSHTDSDYAAASNHYEKTARLLKQSKSWGYLSANFVAWARLEQAEDLSIKRSSEARAAFTDAARLFREARKTLQAQLEKVEATAERTSVKRLITASDTRRDYCLRRSAVEEATPSNTHGDSAAASGTRRTAGIAVPAPNEEVAVGLERFKHADIHTKLAYQPEEIMVGQEFDLEMHVVNMGREAVLLTKIENILPAGLQITTKPDFCHVEDGHLSLNGKRLDPLETEEIRLVFTAVDKGTIEVTPRLVCVEENGQQLTRGLDPVTVAVLEVELPGRITTGHGDLDTLLFGGIPENYAVILTTLSCNERDLLIKRFLEAGVKKNQTTFYITTEAAGVEALAAEAPSTFFLFICNPRADVMIKSAPNVFKLKGVESLTEISIALTKAFRHLDASISGPRRACIEIISDVLLQHHAVTTRKWLIELAANLKSTGFTTLAVMNPLMHPREEVHAILGLFDGEISIYEKETGKGSERRLKVRKMFNQRYLEKELTLKRGTPEN